MDQIKINTIDELYNDEKFIKFNAFKNLDATKIDLSNFHNNIRDIINCNLENTGLPIFLTHENNTGFTSSIRIVNSNIIGAKFVSDEKIQNNSTEKINVYLDNVMLDEAQIKYLNILYKNDGFQIYYDLDTILNNDGIVIDSLELLGLLTRFLDNTISRTPILKEKEMYSIIDKIEKTIVKDEVGDLKTIYDNIVSQLSDYEKIIMFRNSYIQNITFENLEINEKIHNILKTFTIRNCNFKNVTFKNSLNTMFEQDDNFFYYSHSYNSVENTKMPNINYNSWQDITSRRISSTPFTFMKNLYLELDRKCNAKCSFCRNDCMEKCKYKFKDIMNNLNGIIRNIDNIFIGGGEPTVNKKDLQKLLDMYRYSRNIYIVSNGTATLDFYKKLDSQIYISRHHFDDKINADIFGINKKKILNMDDLSQLYNLTLACTCINGGIDSIDKIIEYLQEAESYNIRNIVFSNLHDDASVNTFDSSYKNLNVKNGLFDEVIEILKYQGFEYNYPVISSGGYKMYMLKNNPLRLNVVFKQYISKEELDNLWTSAVKRTFDLSMAPDGTIYDNWAQDKNKTKVLK